METRHSKSSVSFPSTARRILFGAVKFLLGAAAANYPFVIRAWCLARNRRDRRAFSRRGPADRDNEG